MLSHHQYRQQWLRLDETYKDYLAQFDKPVNRWSNCYNLFHDCNLHDRIFLTRARRHINKIVRRLP